MNQKLVYDSSVQLHKNADRFNPYKINTCDIKQYNYNQLFANKKWVILKSESIKEYVS